MNGLINVSEMLEAQLRQIENWHDTPEQPADPTDLQSRMKMLVYFNTELWHQEDKARDDEATDAIISDVKRKIDKLNQQRNDMIEQIDETLLSALINAGIVPDDRVPMNSETPGSIVDRLSINALKIFHMDEETKRTDASDAHIQKCADKLAILKEQRADLGQTLDELLEDLEAGEKRMKVYRQMKMYNDPSLNPVLYRKKGGQ